MARFEVGDKIVVNSQQMTVRSWPANDQGPFVAVWQHADGGDVLHTGWTGELDENQEPAHKVDNVELVEKGQGERSTLGALPPGLFEKPGTGPEGDAPNQHPVDENDLSVIADAGGAGPDADDVAPSLTEGVEDDEEPQA